MVALIVGTALALGALGFVLYPLLFVQTDGPAASASPRPSTAPDDRELAVAALREIEFDRATGKLSEADYAGLKARYTAQAVQALRREHRRAGVAHGIPWVSLTPEDDVERLIEAYRASHPLCAACGPRPEPDALFCSNCGAHIGHLCGRCQEPVSEHDARFCSTCGAHLTA